MLSRLDLPLMTRFEGRRPLAFMVPSSRMRDLDGNGPGYPVQFTLRDLALALCEERGFAVYRFVTGEGDASALDPPLEPEDCVNALREAIRDPRVDPDRVALLGIGDGADLIARSYYDFYSVRFPRAAVLLSPSPHPIHLNKLTCPYLVLHGRKDPRFEIEPYSRVEEAVHHHQMRYGDLTTNFLFPHLGRELGVSREPGASRPPVLDVEVVAQVSDWLKRAVMQGLRPQEPGVAA